MELTLGAARRDELVNELAAWLTERNLREPAALFLTLHLPLAFFGSQLLLAAQPFLGVFFGEQEAHELALFCQESENLERLVARLDASRPGAKLMR